LRPNDKAREGKLDEGRAKLLRERALESTSPGEPRAHIGLNSRCAVADWGAE
jgi:hypothetical protein